MSRLDLFRPIVAAFRGRQLKPAPETYASILSSLLWGVLAFRTRSLLSGFLQHFLLGVSLDWLICYG